MSKIVEYLQANPKVLVFLVTIIGQLIATVWALVSKKKVKAQRDGVTGRAFDAVGLHKEGLNLLTSAIEDAGKPAKPVKVIVKKATDTAEPSVGFLIDDAVEAARRGGKKSSLLGNLKDEEKFRVFADEMLKGL